VESERSFPNSLCLNRLIFEFACEVDC